MALLPLAGSSGGTIPGDSDGAIGQLLRFSSSGALLEDHGDGVTGSAAFGVALSAAIGALSSGETLLMRGFVAAITAGIDLLTDNVRLLAEDVTIVPDNPSNYAFLMKIWGDDVEVRGLKFDGLGVGSATQSGIGYGLWILGDRVRCYDIECSRTRGSSVAEGNALRIGLNPGDANDCIIDGYTSYSAGYAALLLSDANRATVRNVYIQDPLNRAVNIQGTGEVEWITLENFNGLLTVLQTDQAGNKLSGVFTNCNIDGKVKRLNLKNYKMVNQDVVEPGYSYDYPSQLQMLKMHNVGTLYMEDVTLCHGANKQSTTAPSFRHSPLTSEGQMTDEMHFIRCNFAAEVLFPTGASMPYVRFSECRIGARTDMITSTAVILIGNWRGERLIADACEFNVHTRNAVVGIRDEIKPWGTIDIRNCRFLAHQTTNPEIFNANLQHITGRVVQTNNTFINTGGGGWNVGTNADAELTGTTDPSGALLFDSDKAAFPGAGFHTEPWTGYGDITSTEPTPPFTYFPTLPPASVPGARIINTKYNANATPNTINSIKGWVSAPTPRLVATFSATTDVVTATGHTFANGDVVYFHNDVQNTSYVASFTGSGSANITVTGHTFAIGNVVVFTSMHGDLLPKELGADTPYYVKTVAGSVITVSATAGGTTITFAEAPVGTSAVRRRELPAELIPYKRYYVIEQAANVFKVSLTSGGTAINLTDTGFGTRYVTRVQWQKLT